MERENAVLAFEQKSRQLPLETSVERQKLCGNWRVKDKSAGQPV
jgi:hypothetical protein